MNCQVTYGDDNFEYIVIYNALVCNFNVLILLFCFVSYWNRRVHPLD